MQTVRQLSYFKYNSASFRDSNMICLYAEVQLTFFRSTTFSIVILQQESYLNICNYMRYIYHTSTPQLSWYAQFVPNRKTISSHLYSHTHQTCRTQTQKTQYYQLLKLYFVYLRFLSYNDDTITRIFFDYFNWTHLLLLVGTNSVWLECWT